MESLARDLVGPEEGDDEVITDYPITKYICGVLYPQSSDAVDPSEDRDGEASAEDEELDSPVSLANVRYPSSLGVTFSVDTENVSTVVVKVSAATYSLAAGGEPPEDTDNDSPGAQGKGAWKRTSLQVQPIPLDVSNPCPGDRQVVAEGLELYYRVRSPDETGATSVTVALVNTKKQRRAALTRDADSFFQPTLSISAPDVSGQPFVERNHSSAVGVEDPDLASYLLLYRHAKSYAIGHGCSAAWTIDGEAPSLSRIYTTFIPTHELLLADQNQAIPPVPMSALSDPSECLPPLTALCDGYGCWIEMQGENVASLPSSELRATAENHVELCRTALARMRDGVELLSGDETAREAFCLANRAMTEQRARTDWIRDGKVTPHPDLSRPSWRPFQIAFVLLCLRGLVDREHPDRETADLLWFPTGGGKTEAYLCLIAFSVFLRRLRADGVGSGGGVTALMRYTLRLLTAQQFQRAAILICACELLRRRSPRLGAERIGIGLWVGQGGTPNSIRQAKESLAKLRSGGQVSESNPVQLQTCPWCGTPLTHKNYWVDEKGGRLVIHCDDSKCEFGEELPVWVVDDDIYRFRPSLLISTVDKFAALPWKEGVGHLFGIGHEDGPPDLIVQDELHLISGPLGTLAGLYETAIDRLSSVGSSRPKVVASTATIRRASAQTRNLFDRNVLQFPPPGLDARDSYFAVEAPPENKASRLYLGAMAPGTSHSTLMIRIYARLLQSAMESDGPDAARDAYWTLVGYFNSLRVLGAARLQVEDDVKDRIALISKNGQPRTVENSVELTSREASSEIPQHLKRMALSYPAPDALDVILATNMISVGMDIDRLGLMVVMGQPQSTSEYIQATSRVGRQPPGLVVVAYNAGRSRDRSHYEGFATYHSALYRQVESTSVTPFSARSRDRALHAVFIGLARMTIPELRPNEGAARILQVESQLQPVREVILDRIAELDPSEGVSAALQLDLVVRQWKERAEEIPDLVFWDTKNDGGSNRGLLVDAADDEAPARTFPTLWSLRDVDRSSNVYLD